jgi:hypothetical protein
VVLEKSQEEEEKYLVWELAWQKLVVPVEYLVLGLAWRKMVVVLVEYLGVKESYQVLDLAWQKKVVPVEYLVLLGLVW